ncbi:MAG TPA: TonB-dependent receptor [Gallionella sp.]|nr:TonB-dependent receptor [Gallionella sp.]
MNQKLITVALFGAIALPIAAYAETSSLDEVVITATRMPQSLNKAIADTTVLNEQAIRQSGAPDVSTLLRSLAGVEVVQTGGLGAQSSIFMRGTNSNQVLVLLDGVRINSATWGATALEHLMLDSIERIEIVRGNVSSLYGSEAIGGVIQLFTKHGHGAPAFNANAGVGSHGTQRLAAGYSGVVNDTSFSVNAGKVKTDGVSAINPLLAPGANPNNNGYDNNTVDAQIKHAINADHLLSASLFSTRGNISNDNAFGSPTGLNNTVENIDKLSLASDDQLSEMWHSQVRLAQGIDDSHSYSTGAIPSRFQTRSNQFAWQNNLKIADGQQVNLAAEHLGQAVTSTTHFSQTSRTVNSLLGGYTGEYGAQQVQFNLRHDNYSDFGTANTGLLGYGLSFADNWRVTASVSNAFKAPTFNDLFYPFQNFGFGFSYSGNPNLKPERSQNKEIGLHYAANGQRVDAVYFDNRISDLIVGNGLPALLYININQARIDGQELSYAGDFGNTHLKGNATFQNPRDAATGQVLQRRAKEFGSIAASHDFAAWNLGAEVRYSGARQDTNYVPFPATPVTLPSYSLLNLTSRYNIDKHLNLTARVDNLFKRNYSEAYSYNTLGRTLFVGLNYQQ